MKRATEQMQAFCPWQECQDESSGYSYYWNMTTNEVTWEMPPDYRLALQKWQLLQQQSLDKKTGEGSPQISTSSVAEKLEASKNKLNRNHKDTTSTKKKYPFESDSEEEEKIELITSYGSDSSDNSDNENSSQSKPNSKNSSKESSKSKLSNPRTAKPSNKPDPKSTNTNCYGPCFPIASSLNSDSAVTKKAKSISLVPYGDASDITHSDDSFTHNSNSSQQIESKNSVSKSEKKTVEDEEDEESDDEEFDEDESLILSKLRSKAMVLKQLGGEIPDEIKCLIDSENPDIGIDDILALIENETPPDHATLTDSEKLLSKQQSGEIVIKQEKADSPTQVSEKNSTNELAAGEEPSPFALIAGYGDDSDQEESTSPTKSSETGAAKRKALFPIDEKQNKSRNGSKAELSSKPAFKKIKLSARAKALINASIITAKARATPSINEVKAPDARPDSSASLTVSSEAITTEPVPIKDPIAVELKEFSDSKESNKEEMRPAVSERVEPPEKKKTAEILKPTIEKPSGLSKNVPSTSQMPSQTKSSLSTLVTSLKSSSTNLETSSPQSSCYTAVWDSATTYATEEKRGFGFSDDAKSSSGSSFSFYRSKSEKKDTPIQFVKAETINVNPPPPTTVLPQTEKDDGASKSEIDSLSEVIVEKVKFLSEGKEPVSPVQIMTIQVEVDEYQAPSETVSEPDVARSLVALRQLYSDDSTETNSNVAPLVADTLTTQPVLAKPSSTLLCLDKTLKALGKSPETFGLLNSSRHYSAKDTKSTQSRALPKLQKIEQILKAKKRFLIARNSSKPESLKCLKNATKVVPSSLPFPAVKQAEQNKNGDKTCFDEVITENNSSKVSQLIPQSSFPSSQDTPNTGLPLLPVVSTNSVRRPLQPTPAFSQENKMCDVNRTNFGEMSNASKLKDHFDSLGKHVTSKLRSVIPKQSLFAQKLIYEIIFEGEMESLNQYTNLHYNSLSRRNVNVEFCEEPKTHDNNRDENASKIMTQDEDDDGSSNREDALDVFGKLVAYKLQDLSGNQNIFAMKLIDETLGCAVTARLTQGSKLHIPAQKFNAEQVPQQPSDRSFRGGRNLDTKAQWYSGFRGATVRSRPGFRGAAVRSHPGFRGATVRSRPGFRAAVERSRLGFWGRTY